MDLIEIYQHSLIIKAKIKAKREPKLITGKIQPENPIHGDMWINLNDGVLHIWDNDQNSWNPIKQKQDTKMNPFYYQIVDRLRELHSLKKSI